MNDVTRTSKKLDLLPCPHCGKGPPVVAIVRREELYADDDPVTHSDSFAVNCNASSDDNMGGCGAVSGFELAEAEAAASWNRRAAHEPRACNHGAISPKGTMFYHGFVDPRVNLWRCEVCKGLYEGNLTEPNTLGSQKLTLVSSAQPPGADLQDRRERFGAISALEVVDRLLHEAGYTTDSSTRHNLGIAISYLRSPPTKEVNECSRSGG